LSRDTEQRLFEMAQVHSFSDAGIALQRAAAEAAGLRAGVTPLVRTVTAELDRLEKLRQDAEAAAELQLQGKENNGRAIASDEQIVSGAFAQDMAKLDQAMPAVADLLRPQIVDLNAAQKLLHDGEGLLIFTAGSLQTYSLLVTRTDSAVAAMPIFDFQLKALVAKLRKLPQGSDFSDLDNPMLNDLQYDAGTAYTLYQQLMAPLEPLLGQVHELIVLPDGPLATVPLSVLVTEKPPQDIVPLEGLPSIKWFGIQKAITVVPSISSWQALRSLTSAPRATNIFLGIGDPDLKPPNSPAPPWADQLAPLPEAGVELTKIAKLLNAPSGSVHLQDEATKTWLKKQPLDQFRMIEFATHGLLEEEARKIGATEAVLVLTPHLPDDDGLLRASEIAGLNLNADWVILSACNTAGDEGGTSLAGLARAFFSAGARSLLVSHWPVVSDAAVELTTGAVAALSQEPQIGRAEAMRRSMAAMVADAVKTHHPELAHPLLWAPFVVVGAPGT
jgi:CHAT domain-containing protein